MNTQLLELDERDLSPLLDMILRGKNDDYDEETMEQSMSIYRKLLKPSCYSGLGGGCNQSLVATAGGGSSVGGLTSATAVTGAGNGCGTGIEIHEGTLVYAVRKKYTDEYMMELMNLLLDAIEESNSGTNVIVDGGRILGLALIYGNVGASRVIIQRYPESLFYRDLLRGQLPLHIACHVGMMVEDDDQDDYDEDGFSIRTGATGRSSVIRRKRRKHRQAEVIELLIKEGMKHNVGGINGVGGLYDQDNTGTTPLMQLIHALNNPFTWDDDHSDDDDDTREEVDAHADFNVNEQAQGNSKKPKAKKRPLANLEICIKAAWNNRGPNNHFPILHEAMNISSPEAFYRILEIVKHYDNDLSGIDQRGRTALVKAIYIDKIIQRRTSTKDVIKMILGGVTSKCATLRDGAGRLPLHIAAEMGLLWNDGLSDIVNAHYAALDEPHSVSEVYPFILAAQAGPGNKDLDTLYRLVRERPKLIVRAKKDKRKARAVNTNPFFLDFNQQKRPLTPSVHSPLVHVGSMRSRRSTTLSESGSDRTTPTIHSSSTATSGEGNDDTVRFKTKKRSNNPFDD
jgi:hypothetical protein